MFVYQEATGDGRELFSENMCLNMPTEIRIP